MPVTTRAPVALLMSMTESAEDAVRRAYETLTIRRVFLDEPTETVLFPPSILPTLRMTAFFLNYRKRYLAERQFSDAQQKMPDRNHGNPEMRRISGDISVIDFLSFRGMTSDLQLSYDKISTHFRVIFEENLLSHMT